MEKQLIVRLTSGHEITFVPNYSLSFGGNSNHLFIIKKLKS